MVLVHYFPATDEQTNVLQKEYVFHRSVSFSSCADEMGEGGGTQFTLERAT